MMSECVISHTYSSSTIFVSTDIRSDGNIVFFFCAKTKNVTAVQACILRSHASYKSFPLAATSVQRCAGMIAVAPLNTSRSSSV